MFRDILELPEPMYLQISEPRHQVSGSRVEGLGFRGSRV